MKDTSRSHAGFAMPAILLAFAVLSIPAKANMVQNPSFEITGPITVTTVFPSAGVADWSAGTSEALVMPNWWTSGYLFPAYSVGLAGAVPATSPDGGNWVFSDSDYYNTAITQTINGLNPGDTYNLTFYQGMAQDTEPYITIPGPVNAYWHVSLGASSQDSTMMYGDGTTLTFSNWAQQSMSFTATSSSEVLSFFAVGAGAPPLAFLDGINLEQSSVPEPATIWLAGMCVAMMLGWKPAMRRKAALAKQSLAA